MGTLTRATRIRGPSSAVRRVMWPLQSLRRTIPGSGLKAHAACKKRRRERGQRKKRERCTFFYLGHEIVGVISAVFNKHPRVPFLGDGLRMEHESVAAA